MKKLFEQIIDALLSAAVTCLLIAIFTWMAGENNILQDVPLLVITVWIVIQVIFYMRSR